VLNPFYEEEFLGFSYGFRPDRGWHDFFDSVSKYRLMRFVEHRIGDARIYPPDPELAEGGCLGGWGRHGQRNGDGTGLGNFAAVFQLDSEDNLDFMFGDSGSCSSPSPLHSDVVALASEPIKVRALMRLVHFGRLLMCRAAD
jgi:hypothetical protein